MKPRLGFLGVGWIGQHRMMAIANSGRAEIVAVSDASADAAAEASAVAGAPAVEPARLFDGSLDLDGMVIATPSALHAGQAEKALEQGLAVFCQKPLGCTAGECRSVIEAARRADRLLAVDLSYRHLVAVQRMGEVMASGEIGDIYAVELVFHNAHGPDKAWFSDPSLSGGGCVIDLGIHLVDLALWLLRCPKVEHVDARLFAGGRPFSSAGGAVEDYAVARLDLADGRVVNFACSWFLAAGQDALIGATFVGTRGAVHLANVAGSYYDFRAEVRHGTSVTSLAEPPDDWGGRAAVSWVRRLAAGEGFDPANDELIEVASVLDRVYGR